MSEEISEQVVVAAPLRAGGPGTARAGDSRGQDNLVLAVRTAQTSANGHGVARDVTHTLDGAEGQAVYVPDVVGALSIGAHGGGGLTGQDAYTGRILSTGRVRRLTPTECERLQGFPDHWTRWGADGREMSDTARYRMLGNAVAVPVAEWLAWRMRYALETSQ